VPGLLHGFRVIDPTFAVLEPSPRAYRAISVQSRKKVERACRVAGPGQTLLAWIAGACLTRARTSSISPRFAGGAGFSTGFG